MGRSAPLAKLHSAAGNVQLLVYCCVGSCNNTQLPLLLLLLLRATMIQEIFNLLRNEAAGVSTAVRSTFTHPSYDTRIPGTRHRYMFPYVPQFDFIIGFLQLVFGFSRAPAPLCDYRLYSSCSRYLSREFNEDNNNVCLQPASI